TASEDRLSIRRSPPHLISDAPAWTRSGGFPHAGSSPQPLSCDFPDQARDDVALGLFGRLQNLELIGGQVKLNRLLHASAQLVRLDGVKLDGDEAAEALRSGVAGLGRAGRQIPFGDLLGVRAIRSKLMSASGASSCSVSSIFSPAFTPDGSKSPR